MFLVQQYLCRIIKKRELTSRITPAERESINIFCKSLVKENFTLPFIQKYIDLYEKLRKPNDSGLYLDCIDEEILQELGQKLREYKFHPEQNSPKQTTTAIVITPKQPLILTPEEMQWINDFCNNIPCPDVRTEAGKIQIQQIIQTYKNTVQYLVMKLIRNEEKLSPQEKILSNKLIDKKNELGIPTQNYPDP